MNNSKKDYSVKIFVITVLFFGIFGYLITNDTGAAMELAGLAFAITIFVLILQEGFNHW